MTTHQSHAKHLKGIVFMYSVSTKIIQISLVVTLSLLLISACVSEPVFNELPPDLTPLLPTFGNHPQRPHTDPTATPAP